MAKQPDQGWREWVLNNSLPKMEATSTTGTAGFAPAPANPQPFSAGMQLQPQFDVIELLPPGAQEKLRALRLRSAESHAVIPPFSEIQAASAERVAAANALKRLTDHPQDGGFGLKPDSNRQVTQAQRTLDRATEEFERIKQRSETKTAAWQAASGPLANVETWLKSGKPGGTALEDFEGEPPKLVKNETVIDAVERLRRRVRELKADLHRIASAPYPSSYAKQRMRAQIEALAMQGAPSASSLIELDGKIEFQTQQVQSQVYNAQAAVAFAEMPDTVALVAWLHKDALVAALDREIASEADDKAALSHEARQKAEAEVQGDLLSVERDECFFVWRAIDERLPTEHRADVDPRALLSITLVSVPRGETPATSPEHAYDIVRPGGRR